MRQPNEIVADVAAYGCKLYPLDTDQVYCTKIRRIPAALRDEIKASRQQIIGHLKAIGVPEYNLSHDEKRAATNLCVKPEPSVPYVPKAKKRHVVLRDMPPVEVQKAMEHAIGVGCEPFKGRSKRKKRDRVAIRARRKAKKRIWGAYRDRNKVIRKMGFKDYREYLDSDLWASIRKRVFALKGNRCFACGSQARYVHHADYGKKTLDGGTLDGLWPVCHECHEHAEMDGDNKRSLSEANEILFAKADNTVLFAEMLERVEATTT